MTNLSNNTNNLKTELKENGFIALKGLIPKKKCEAVLKNTISLLSNYYPVSKDLLKVEKAWESPSFHSHMKNLRDNDPELFGFLYDAAQSSIALDQLFLDKKLTEVVADLLGVKPESLSSSGHIQKMEAPSDSRNLYTWHQEQSYYPQNRNGEHGLVAWIPLMDTPIEAGALITAKGSHDEGFVKPNATQKSKLHSLQNTIPDKSLKKYEHVSFPLDVGDALVMYMTTSHKSGANKTNKFRFTAIGRYHNAISNDFAPFRYRYTFNRYTVERLKQNGYDIQDIRV